MVPAKIERRFLRCVLSSGRAAEWGSSSRASAPTCARAAPAAVLRGRAAAGDRCLFLVLIPSVIASGFHGQRVARSGAATPVEVAIVLLFGAPFGWISIGFGPRRWVSSRWSDGATASAITNGITEHRTRRSRPRASHRDRHAGSCEEPVERAFKPGRPAIRHSLERAGVLEHFHLHPEPTRSIVRDRGARDRVHARRDEKAFDSVSVGAGSPPSVRGNVAEFCRRWGRLYGSCSTPDSISLPTPAHGAPCRSSTRKYRLTLPANCRLPVIQIAARAQQQFARAGSAGPTFAAGCMYLWQPGDGRYRGHNAIISHRPVHSQLRPAAPAGHAARRRDHEPPTSVEAALLGRAGRGARLASSTCPSRSRRCRRPCSRPGRAVCRWCHRGNLQQFRACCSASGCLGGAPRAVRERRAVLRSPG